MRIIVLLLICLSSLNAQAQSASGRVFVRPDYAVIEKAVKDKDSPYYYPALMARYKADDTTLNLYEYKYLYYGAYFNEAEADSVQRNKADAARTERNKIMDKDSLNDNDRRRLLQLVNTELSVEPLDLRNLSNKLNICYDLYDTACVKRTEHKLLGILRNIRKSGDGLTCKTAYHIYTIADEYFMLSLLKYKFVSQALTADECDYLEVQPNKDNVSGVYFDVKQMMEQMSKALAPSMEDAMKKMMKDEDGSKSDSRQKKK